MGCKRNKRGQFLKGSHWREPQPFRSKKWLVAQYVDSQRSASEIAAQFGVTAAAVLFWLRRHGIARRSVSQARAIKHWGPVGSDNPMWNKRGELNPRWLGGVTPERQAFYASHEWKRACSAVWKRDAAACRRCQIRHIDAPDLPFHVHHIVSFADTALRADINNLVLVCEICHHFIHSRKNTAREYLPQKPHST